MRKTALNSGNLSDGNMKGAVMEKIKNDMGKTALFLKIGIIGACIILAGDMLMGWGIKDMNAVGIEREISQYLALSDKRMLLAAIFGFTGVPLAVVGHFGIYRLIKPYSPEYSKMYALGNIGFLAFGGAGVHVSSVEAAFFYKYMNATGSVTALESAMKFVSCFLVPLYIVVLISWFIMVYAHIRAVLKGLTPFSLKILIFSMPVGILLTGIIGIFGNYEIVNALMVGAFSIGNIWTLAGHLFMVNKLNKK